MACAVLRITVQCRHHPLGLKKNCALPTETVVKDLFQRYHQETGEPVVLSADGYDIDISLNVGDLAHLNITSIKISCAEPLEAEETRPSRQDAFSILMTDRVFLPSIFLFD